MGTHGAVQGVHTAGLLGGDVGKLEEPAVMVEVWS